MKAENLVTMANQIGAFFESYPDRAEASSEIAGHLRREMPARFLKPFQNPQAPAVGNRSKSWIHFHIDN